jgi:NAD(P)-dependent dehydrogenase (short-subunit alcohol dehydrogenase family)
VNATPTPRRALVTGASRGIGRGIAIALAQGGHSVAVAARDEQGLNETARSAGDGPILPCDLKDLAACGELTARAEAALEGPVEILVHVAGVALNGAMGSLTLEDWEQSLRVNVTSLFVLAGEALPAMQSCGWGRIVTIGSLYSRFGVSRTAAYTTSKHAVLGLTRVLSAEGVKHGVTANCLLPGWVDTEMVRGEAAKVTAARGTPVDEVIRKFIRNQPLGRMVTPAEIGALTAFLCSEAGAPITGQAINIDGGSYQA